MRYYNVVSGFYLASFGFVLTCVISLQYISEEPFKCLVLRLVLTFINLITLCVSLLSFEIKSFLEDKIGYIKSFWNQNDICLFFMSITVFVMELNIFLNHRDTLEEDYGLLESDVPLDNVTRMLKKKAARGDNTFDVKEYYSNPTYETYLRMIYAILTINSFLKILNVAQFSENVAFLVKMLGFIFVKFSPFIFFWFGIIIMFSLCI